MRQFINNMTLTMILTVLINGIGSILNVLAKQHSPGWIDVLVSAVCCAYAFSRKEGNEQ